MVLYDIEMELPQHQILDHATQSDHHLNGGRGDLEVAQPVDSGKGLPLYGVQGPKQT